jgi:hypothetical protein
MSKPFADFVSAVAKIRQETSDRLEEYDGPIGEALDPRDRSWLLEVRELLEANLRYLGLIEDLSEAYEGVLSAYNGRQPARASSPNRAMPAGVIMLNTPLTRRIVHRDESGNIAYIDEEPL